MSIFDLELFINILIHITLLFTFLSILFYIIITPLTTNTINSTFNNILTTSTNNYNDSLANNYNDPNRTLYRQIKNLNKTTKEYKMFLTSEQYNDVNNFDYHISNDNMSFYQNLFLKDDMNITLINNNLFNNMIYVSSLLYFFLFFSCFILLISNNISVNQLIEIFGENFIVFILIGIFQYYFFLNIGSKYLSSPPSELFISFVNDLKKVYGISELSTSE
jgi:hypothetical protein